MTTKVNNLISFTNSKERLTALSLVMLCKLNIRAVSRTERTKLLGLQECPASYLQNL